MPMASLYTFTDDSPDWPAQFEQEAARLRTLVGDELVAVHHIGSTSVPGLAANVMIRPCFMARPQWSRFGVDTLIQRVR